MPKLLYISNGAYETGGYNHEQFLSKTLAQSENLSYQEIRFRKQFKGPMQWFILFCKAFFSSKADVIVTVSRLAWPVYLRTIFSNTKILLVLHNHDENDGKRPIFYQLLNAFLDRAPKKRGPRFRLVCISDYWKNYFNQKFALEKQSLVFPNFFDIEKLIFFRGIAKKSPGLIHLGQWSDKIDKKSYLILMHALKQKGYAFYFSSNQEKSHPNFPISYFEHQEAFHKQMAMAHATVVMNRVNEGWPRLVHESMLLGTPVITLNKGGIEPLVKMGNGYLVDSIEEILQVLITDLKPIDYDALEKYSTNNTHLFLKPFQQFIHD